MFRNSEFIVRALRRGGDATASAYLPVAVRKFFVALLILTLVLPAGSGPALAQTAFKISDVAPKGFEALSEAQTTLLDVYYAGRQVASTMATFGTESVVFANPIEILSKIPRLKNQEKLLSVLSGPMVPNVELVCFEDAKPEDPCGKLKPEVIGVILDEGNFRVEVFIHPDFLDVHELGIPRFLPPSESDLSVVSSFAGAVSGSASATNTHNTRNQTVIGYKQSRARINSAYSNTSEWVFDTAFLEHDILEQRYRAGVFQSTSMDNIGEIKLFGAGYTTTTDTRVDLDIGFGNQLIVFLPKAAQVDLFKDGRLIGSRFYEAGKQVLDTSQLPEGAYDVTLKIKERGGASREETQFYTKSTSLPPKDAPLYYVEGGMLLNDVTTPFPTRSNIPIVHYGAMFRLNDNLGLGGDFITSDKVSVAEFRAIYLGRVLRLRGAGVLTTDDDIAASVTASGDLWDVGYALSMRRNWAGGALASTASNPTFDPIGASFTQARIGLNYAWGQAQYSWSSLYQANDGSADTYSHGPTMTYPLYRDGQWSAMLRMEATRSQDQTLALARVQFRRVDPVISMGGSSGFEHIKRRTASTTTDDGYTADGSVNASWREQDLVPGDLTLGGTFNAETGLRTLQTNADYVSNWGRYALDVDRSWGRNSSGEGASVAGNFATSLISNGTSIVLGGRERRDSGVVVRLDGRAKDAVFKVFVDGQPNGELQVGDSLPLLLAPYKTYAVRIEPKGGDFVSYEADDREITLYPGNVAAVTWSVNPIVAVFGRVLREDGTPVTFARIEGVAGGSFTDDLGYFQAELTDPGALTFRPAQGNVCTVVIPTLPEGEVFADLKDLVCRDTLLEARDTPPVEVEVAQATETAAEVTPTPVTPNLVRQSTIEAAAQVLEEKVEALEKQVEAAERDAAQRTKSKAPILRSSPGVPVKSSVSPAVVAAKSEQPSRYSVQLAAYRDRKHAAGGWRKISARAGDLLADRAAVVTKVTLAGRGTFYRLQAGPPSDRAVARELCDGLLGKSLSCRVVRMASSAALTSPVTPPVTPIVRAGQTVGAASGMSYVQKPVRSEYLIQLGSHRSRQLAQQDWRRIVGLSEGFLSGLEPIVSRIDLGTRGVYHRLHIQAPARHREAQALCQNLKDLALPCLVVRRPAGS